VLVLSNAKVFDGKQLLPGKHSVVLDGNKIDSIESITPANAATVIDVDGMTVLPGLITCHLHPDFYKFSLAQGFAGEQLGKELPPGVLMAIGVRTCRVLLESGFTGYVGAACSNDIDAQLKMAIAKNIIPGPRIRACGHHIGTTADFNNSPKWWQRYETPGTDICADGPDALRKLVRDEIRRGVETIKIFASSGHGFPAKTIRNMSRDEIAAVVNTAHERGAKVRAHVCDKALMLECIELGVDILDHGDDIDEECIDAMAKAKTFWVPSLMFPKIIIDLNMADAAGHLQAQYNNVRRMLPLAQKAGVRILVGDDYSGVFRDMLEDDPLDHEVGRYGREFSYYGAIEGLKPNDVLSWGTKNAGELLVDEPAKVGVIEPGALADLIVVEGDPVADLNLLSSPQKALKAVIRDGEFAIDRLNKNI
jgi:imidazolonepropionase-like amidohydrolase